MSRFRELTHQDIERLESVRRVFEGAPSVAERERARLNMVSLTVELHDSGVKRPGSRDCSCYWLTGSRAGVV